MKAAIAHCLKITQNVSFEFWTCLVTLFDRKLNWQFFWQFLWFFGHLKWDIFCNFQKLFSIEEAISQAQNHNSSQTCYFETRSLFMDELEIWQVKLSQVLYTKTLGCNTLACSWSCCRISLGPNIIVWRQFLTPIHDTNTHILQCILCLPEPFFSGCCCLSDTQTRANRAKAQCMTAIFENHPKMSFLNFGIFHQLAVDGAFGSYSEASGGRLSSLACTPRRSLHYSLSAKKIGGIK